MLFAKPNGSLRAVQSPAWRQFVRVFGDDIYVYLLSSSRIMLFKSLPNGNYFQLTGFAMRSLRIISNKPVSQSLPRYLSLRLARKVLMKGEQHILKNQECTTETVGSSMPEEQRSEKNSLVEITKRKSRRKPRWKRLMMFFIYSFL